TSTRSRRVTGWVFQAALSMMGMRLLSDTQCGFKLYRADAAAFIGREACEDGWAFDLEHLLLAKRAGLGIAEIGVVWDHHDGGKVNSLRDGLVMLRRAAGMKIRARAIRPAASVIEVKGGPALTGNRRHIATKTLHPEGG
ncbi:MAG: hypothetical protein ACREN5_11045, partial [Gemmatimonadales bacterium]